MSTFELWLGSHPRVEVQEVRDLQFVEFLIDILDDRLDMIEAENDRERLRLYFELWQAGAVDPLRDPGVVVIATLDGGPGSGRVIVNDGEGGYGETH